MSSTILNSPPGVQTYLKHTKAMVGDIVNPEERFDPDSNYRPYYRSPGCYYNPFYGFPLFAPHHVIHHSHSGSSNSKDSSSGALITGAFFTLASMAALYGFGSEIAKRSNAVKDLKRFERDLKIAAIDLQTASLTPLQSHTFDSINQLQKDILTSYKRDAEVNLLIKGSLTTGLLSGAFAALQAYFKTDYKTAAVTSALLTVGSLFAWAFKSGFESTNLTSKRKAQELLSMIQNFEQSLKI